MKTVSRLDERRQPAYRSTSTLPGIEWSSPSIPSPSIPIREALRRATELWIERQEAVDLEQSVFTSVEAIRDRASHRTMTVTTLTTEYGLLEQWKGDADSYRFAHPD